MFVVEPIGVVHSARSEPVDDGWDAVEAFIELDGRRFPPDALAGLDEFSHVEVLYLFDRVDEADVEVGTRRPRGNPAWPPVGIFAQRGKGRPNRIGATVCRLLAVTGLRVHVAGLDAIDGSPVVDIKPWMDEFGPRGPTHQPAWSRALMAAYWAGDADPAS